MKAHIRGIFIDPRAEEIGRKTTRVSRWRMRSNILIDSRCPRVVRSSSKRLHYRLHLCNVRLQERYLTNRFHYELRRTQFMATKRCTYDDSIRLELAQTTIYLFHFSFCLYIFRIHQYFFIRRCIIMILNTLYITNSYIN